MSQTPPPPNLSPGAIVKEARADMLNSYCATTAIYAGHTHYLAMSTWLDIPQECGKEELCVLAHVNTGHFYISSSVGIVNQDDLSVEALQASSKSPPLASSVWHLSLSSPAVHTLSERFKEDFIKGLERTDLLHQTILQGNAPNHITPGDGRFHFSHPRFLKIVHHPADHRFPQVVLPFPVRSDYRGYMLDHYDLAIGSDLAITGYPSEGPQDSIHDYDMQPFNVFHLGEEVPERSIGDILPGSLASVEYYIMSGTGGGFLGVIHEVNILLTAKELKSGNV